MELPHFPLHEETVVVYDHLGNIVEDNIRKAAARRWLDVAYKSKEISGKPSLFHSIITAARETRPTQRAWETINKGYYDKPLATFLQQARTNRIPTYANLGRFLPHLIESANCPHCEDTLDTFAHRMLTCPHRLPLAQSIRQSLAALIAKSSGHPWSTIAPPDVPNLRALLQAFWPGKIRMQYTSPPPKNPLNLGDPFDKEHGIIKSNDDRDGTIDVGFFKKWNPISKQENEALRFPDQPNQKPQKAPHFERILQIHIELPCRNSLNPPLPLVLSLRSFSALWHRYSSIHGASQQTADAFYDDLLLLLNQEKEGTSRSKTPQKQYSKTARARTSWATPAPLLDILARTFGITYERYCSPLNFSPVFSHGSTIGGHKTSTGERVDSRWGFDHDAKKQDWRQHFGYANPEWLEDDLIDCITRASEAAKDSSKAVRNIAIIPYNQDFPAVKLRLDNSPNHHIIAVFAPNTLAFTPPQVMQGTRSDFGAKPYKNAVALVSWENSLAPPLDDQGLALLGKWCGESLSTPKDTKKPNRVSWSVSVPLAKQNFDEPNSGPIPSLHPFWNDLVQTITPSGDAYSLLRTASGVITKDMKNIFAATHANPSRCSAQLEKLTHDMIVLFHEAWKESNNLVKQVNFSMPSNPDPVIGYDSHHEGVDPDSSCRSSTSDSQSEHEQDPKERSQQTLDKSLKPLTQQGTHTNQIQRFHTTGNFLKTTPFKTHTSPSEFGRPKPKSEKVMLEQIAKLLAYDEPLQRARSNPDITSTCRYCKTNPAVREFPDVSGGHTASCAPCRTQFELTETYGKYSKQSVKCHICGSHQNRSNNTRKPTSPSDASTGWAKHKEGYACAPCKRTESR